MIWVRGVISMTKYLLAILLTLSVVFGASTYKLTGQLAVVEKENVRLVGQVSKAEENAKKAVDSCKITTEVIGDVSSKNQSLSDERTELLEQLERLTNPTPQVKINEAIQKPTEAPATYADSGRLSPDLMRLLDAAYCSGDRDKTTCTSK